MAVHIDGSTIDAAHPLRVARFWAAALEWALDERSRAAAEDADPETASLSDPTGRALPFGFVRVPESKTSKNRMHFDLGAEGELADEVRRLVALGATEADHHHEGGFSWVVMADPEGNEFCVGAADPS
jgi:hypothetical protein